MAKEEKIILTTGNSNPELAKKIAKHLGISLGNMKVSCFSDGETSVETETDVRGKDVFVIQSTCPPANENIMELLIMIDALKRASAKKIIAVIPYYGYSRQDHRVAPGSPISSKLVADLLTIAGASKILTIDLHSEKIEGFFNIPVDNLSAMSVIINHLRGKFNNNIVLVAPDAGGTARARAYGKELGARIVIADKRRKKPNDIKEVEVNIIGEVKNTVAVMIDDMIDTGSTLIKVAGALKKEGAKKIYAAVTHGVLSGNVLKYLNRSPIEKLIITDTIPLGNKNRICRKIVSLSVAELLAEAIEQIHHNE